MPRANKLDAKIPIMHSSGLRQWSLDSRTGKTASLETFVSLHACNDLARTRSVHRRPRLQPLSPCRAVRGDDVKVCWILSQVRLSQSLKLSDSNFVSALILRCARMGATAWLLYGTVEASYLTRPLPAGPSIDLDGFANTHACAYIPPLWNIASLHVDE